MAKIQFRPGVITGTALEELFAACKEHQLALPAVNVINSEGASAVLHAGKIAQSPVIIQFSNGGSAFWAGKFLESHQERASIAGAIAGALSIHHLALVYGVPVVLHTDHAAMKLLPWIEGLIEYSEQYYQQHGKTLFSSHMLDLSEESLEENLNVCAKFLERMHKIQMTLEIELGITGGEEDGVDNSGVDHADLYTKPEDMLMAYDRLHNLGSFSVAASFGNTHGVYSPGNVVLKPEILQNGQGLIQQARNTGPKPLNLVFHGGSGSEQSKITEAISYGVVKFNIDTDTQWAFTKPIREYIEANRDYLQTQIGNPEGADKPNKKYIDPRTYLWHGSKGMSERVVQACKDLGSYNQFSF